MAVIDRAPTKGVTWRSFDRATVKGVT